MVRKKLAVAILALSAFQADLASALGLGNLTVKSALNQPLNAEIRLLDAGDLDANQVKIQLAAPEDFQRAGVDRDFFLTNLHFNVELDGRGGGVIRVTTREPVVEPYLNFVLETRWPTGRLLREYAMLLDPPTFSANGPAAVKPASSTAPAPKPTRRIDPPTVTSETAPASAPAPVSNALPEATQSGEYRIQVSDTLSKIATRHKPASDVSLQQTMVAIQRANPDVFIRGNINLIKSGYVLRLPSADEVRAIGAGEAAQVVQEQTHHWRNGTSSSVASASGPQLDASSSADDKQDEPREQARLSIAASGNADKGGAGEGKGGAKGAAALSNQLTQAQESLEKGQRENKELQSRLDDMERQIATLQRLISLKDDQLAALQVKGADGAQAKPAIADTQSAPTDAATPAPSDASAPAPVATETASAQASADAAPAPAPAPVKPVAPKPSPKPVAPAPEPETPGLLAQLTENPLYAAGGVGALALFGGMLAMRRRRAAAEELEALADLEAAEENLHFEDNFDLENVRVSDNAVTVADAAPAQPTESPATERQPLRSETGDAVAEADIYIAYGRYQQAVDLLLAAIDNEPVRSDLRVKLLEVYLEMRDRESFRRQYSALQGLGDANAIAQIKDVLSSVDGVSDWLGDVPQPGVSPAVTGAALAATAAVTAGFAATAVEPELDSTDDFDLDLDLTESAQAAAEPLADADELVFDLDLEEAAPDLESGLEVTADLSDLALELDGLDLDGPGLDGPGLDGLEIADTKPLEEAISFDSPVLDSALELGSTLELEPEPAELVAGTSISESDPSLPEVDGLELDLEQDDLDLALSELDGSGELEDLAAAIDGSGGLDDLTASDLTASDLVNLGETGELEDLAALLETAEVAAAPEQDFTVALDGLGDDFDLSADLSAPAATPPQLDELAELEALDDLGDLSVDFEAPRLEEQPDAVEEFDFLADADEVTTKLDLARAYIDMGDTDGAKDILDEVLQEGNDGQKQEASVLLARIA